MSTQDQWWTDTTYLQFSAHVRVSYEGVGNGRRCFWLKDCDGRRARVLDVLQVEHTLPIEILGGLRFQGYDHKIDEGTGHLMLQPCEGGEWVDHGPWDQYEKDNDISKKTTPINLSRKLSTRKAIEEAPLDL